MTTLFNSCALICNFKYHKNIWVTFAVTQFFLDILSLRESIRERWGLLRQDDSEERSGKTYLSFSLRRGKWRELSEDEKEMCFQHPS